MNTEESKKIIRDNPQLVLQAMQLCEGIIQRYISWLTETPLNILFKSDIIDIEPEFKKPDGSRYKLGLELVDHNPAKPYVFDIERCGGEQVVKAMDFIARSMSVVYAMIIDHIDLGVVVQKKYLVNAKMIVDPLSTFFLFTEDINVAREIRDKPKRIGFVWH